MPSVGCAVDHACSGGDARPPSRVTILQAQGRRLTKTFRRDRKGRVKKDSYDNARGFLSTEHEIHGLDDFHRLLRELQRRPNCCLIRGTPGRWHPGPGRPHRRLEKPAAELADEEGRFQKLARKGTAAAWQQEQIEAGELWPVTVLPMYREQPTAWVLLDF
jgi:hypothetical protein